MPRISEQRISRAGIQTQAFWLQSLTVYNTVCFEYSLSGLDSNIGASLLEEKSNCKNGVYKPARNTDK